MVENVPNSFPPTIVAVAQAVQSYLAEQHSLLQEIRELLDPPSPLEQAASVPRVEDVCRRALRNMDSKTALIRAHRRLFESFGSLYGEEPDAGPHRPHARRGPGRPPSAWSLPPLQRPPPPPELQSGSRSHRPKVQRTGQWLQRQRRLLDQLQRQRRQLLDQLLSEQRSPPPLPTGPVAQ